MSLVSRYLDPTLVERLNQLQLSGRSVVEGATTGRHRSPVRGASVEFRQHRAYVSGDEPRRLDWRVLARTDRLFVKEYNEETNLRCLLMLDSSGSMSYGRDDARKFDYAAKLAASLGYLMLAQTESVGLATVSAETDQWVAPHTGTGQLARLIGVIERTSAAGGNDLVRALHRAAERLGRRSLIVIVSDFFLPLAPLRQALSRLRHQRHELIALRVLHRDELEFPFRSWCRFNGLEDEQARLCDPAMMRGTYLKNFERHRRELVHALSSVDAEFHDFITDSPLADSLVSFLLHRDVRQRRARGRR